MLANIRNRQGFTLIEVLIAMVIIATAMTAISKSMMQQSRDQLYLQQKIAANWVAMNAIHYIQFGLLQVPTAPFTLDAQVKMLQHDFIWSAQRESTEDIAIDQIIINVKLASNKQSFIQRRSFLSVNAL